MPAEDGYWDENGNYIQGFYDDEGTYWQGYYDATQTWVYLGSSNGTGAESATSALTGDSSATPENFTPQPSQFSSITSPGYA